MTATEHEAIEDRILQAIHEPGADLETLAHEVGGSDHAQAYLVELVSTYSAISTASPAAARASALLEHGLAVAAELGADETTSSQAQERERDGGRD